MISQPTNSGGSEGALIPSRLPIVPSNGDNYLGSGDGGRPSWKEMPNIDEILERLTAIETRLDGASIDAQCQDGTVVVTLNL